MEQLDSNAFPYGPACFLTFTSTGPFSHHPLFLWAPNGYGNGNANARRSNHTTPTPPSPISTHSRPRRRPLRHNLNEPPPTTHILLPLPLRLLLRLTLQHTACIRLLHRTPHQPRPFFPLQDTPLDHDVFCHGGLGAGGVEDLRWVLRGGGGGGGGGRGGWVKTLHGADPYHVLSEGGVFEYLEEGAAGGHYAGGTDYAVAGPALGWCFIVRERLRLRVRLSVGCVVIVVVGVLLILEFVLLRDAMLEVCVEAFAADGS